MTSSFDDALDTVARNMRAAGREPLGYRQDGRPIWPIFGAEDNGGGQGGSQNGGGSGSGSDGGGQSGGQGGSQNGGGSGSGSGSGGGAGGQGGGDLGFPSNTRVEEMTDAQQAAYWKHQSRGHEQRNRAYGNLTPDQLKALQDKAAAHDKMQLDLGTDQERAVAQAKSDAEKAAAARYEPQLARSAIHAAAAAAGINVESVNQALDAGFTDLQKFVEKGEVDADRVKAYIDSIKPDRGGNNGGQQQRGPSGGGHGRRNSQQTATAAERGNAEADRRFGKRKQQESA